MAEGSEKQEMQVYVLFRDAAGSPDEAGLGPLYASGPPCGALLEDGQECALVAIAPVDLPERLSVSCRRVSTS